MDRSPFTPSQDATIVAMYRSGETFKAIALRLAKTTDRIHTRTSQLIAKGELAPRGKSNRSYQAATNKATPRNRDANTRIESGWAEPGTIKMCPVWGWASGLWFAEQGEG